MSDPAKYRSKEELEEYKQKDPLETHLKVILEKKYATQEEIDAMNDRIKAEVEESVRFADESPLPDAAELYTDNYAEADYPFLID